MTDREQSRGELSADQQKLVEQFESDFNKVDRILRRDIGVDRSASFMSVVKQYEALHRAWPHRELLSLVAEVRNAIVHNKTHDLRYVAIPSPALVAMLGACRADFESPELVLPKMRKRVITVATDESLSSVLRKIDQCDYSQFPVYQGSNFVGLLTENGIARWLSKHVSGGDSLVEFDDVTAKQLLKNEEKRSNYEFVSRKLRLDSLPERFGENPALEAVFITETGRKSESLLGVATQWDCLQMKQSK